MADTCHVSESGCLAPAGFQVGGLGGPSGLNTLTVTRGECFACGEPVCVDRSCSRRRNWHDYGRKRVCVDCLEQADAL